jgi:hypothetical protein
MKEKRIMITVLAPKHVRFAKSLLRKNPYLQLKTRNQKLIILKVGVALKINHDEILK